MSNKYIDDDQLCDVFFQWMKEKFFVDEEDMFFILFDFVAPDECCWLIRDYEDAQIIDGKEYGVISYTTDFSNFDTFSNEHEFKFYSYIDLGYNNERPAFYSVEKGK